MKAIITGIAALAMAGGIASTEPAAALTVANIGAAQSAPSEGNVTQGDVTQVQWRRHWRGRYWGGPRYYSYGYRPYYRPHYYGGPRVYIGPRGFGFGW